MMWAEYSFPSLLGHGAKRPAVSVKKAYLVSLILSGTVHLLLLAYATQSPNQQVHMVGVRAPQSLLHVALVATPVSSEEAPAPVAQSMPEQEAMQETLSPSPVRKDDSYPTVLANYYPARALSKMPQALTNFTAILAAGGEISVDDQANRGQVTIRLWINRFGDLDRLSVISSELPQPMEQAAVAAFSQMRFVPGEIDGVAVMTWVDVVLRYGDLLDPSSKAVR